MRVFVFRPESLPLDVGNEGILSSIVTSHKGYKVIIYSISSKLLLERAHLILGDKHLKDIPQLVYILDATSLFELSNDYSEFENLHLTKESRGYYSDWLISSNNYPKPSNVDIYDAPHLMVKMYAKYQSNKLLESL